MIPTMSPSCFINWSRTTPTPSTGAASAAFPTSIETLDPSSPILKSLRAMKPGPGVVYHSIIGSLRPGGVDDTTDGVVPYRTPISTMCASAHASNPRSVVRSDHGVQKDGEAILEVRRILREHIGLVGETARAGREGTVRRLGAGHSHARPPPGPNCCRPCHGDRAPSSPGGSRHPLLNSGELRGIEHDHVVRTAAAAPASCPRCAVLTDRLATLPSTPDSRICPPRW